MTEDKYYIVKAKCGHVGRDKYIPIDFPIKAKSKTEAAAIVRKKARVKKDHKDAVLSVMEVDKTTFDNQQFCNEHDPYLTVRSKHDQNKIMPLIRFRLQEDNHSKKVVLNTKRLSANYKWRKRLIQTEQKAQEIVECCCR